MDSFIDVFNDSFSDSFSGFLSGVLSEILAQSFIKNNNLSQLKKQSHKVINENDMLTK